MMRYRVVIEPEAAGDLRAIHRFIAENDSPGKADRFLRKLQEAIGSLAYMPQRFRRSIYLDEEGVRDMTVRGYTICYTVRESTVHILAVFRQRAF